jgi:hypothetical protein
MTKTLHAHKRTLACRRDKASGARNCAATKLRHPPCPACICRNKEHGLVIGPNINHILEQREVLTPRLPGRSIKHIERGDAATSERRWPQLSTSLPQWLSRHFPLPCWPLLGFVRHRQFGCRAARICFHPRHRKWRSQLILSWRRLQLLETNRIRSAVMAEISCRRNFTRV